MVSLLLWVRRQPVDTPGIGNNASCPVEVLPECVRTNLQMLLEASRFGLHMRLSSVWKVTQYVDHDRG